ncbi:hypothetical protein P280DRAFT_469720 [Massarina eburnea CBS 473.64]|uniref:Uncharacterized protein n=1 Tax=Massarina eburnea CBS 473.64 TaxID=1395130 RepID=A0A6A6RYD3_9PLEO|nr:hypothetical protein P280DRAFT_469720 [Massarina eburnea CBS 473.64]
MVSGLAVLLAIISAEGALALVDGLDGPVCEVLATFLPNVHRGGGTLEAWLAEEGDSASGAREHSGGLEVRTGKSVQVRQRVNWVLEAVCGTYARGSSGD